LSNYLELPIVTHFDRTRALLKRNPWKGKRGFCRENEGPDSKLRPQSVAATDAQ